MERSNYYRGKKRDKCYFCESGPPLREHHVIPQRFDGPDTAENIVELCDLCHKRLERLYDKSFYEWFGIDDESGARKYHRQCQMRDCKNQAKLEAFMNGRVNSDYSSVRFDARGRTLLVCRPCAAKKAKETYDKAVRNYRLEIKRYRRKRAIVHEQARRQHIRDGRDYPSKWLRHNADIKRPPDFDITTNQIFDSMVVEEADD